jgi:hypothetical protein
MVISKNRKSNEFSATSFSLICSCHNSQITASTMQFLHGLVCGMLILSESQLVQHDRISSQIMFERNQQSTQHHQPQILA